MPDAQQKLRYSLYNDSLSGGPAAGGTAGQYDARALYRQSQLAHGGMAAMVRTENHSGSIAHSRGRQAGGIGIDEKKQRLEDLIEEFSIGRIRKQKAYTLSGGERRRTEIARSLAMEPKFLLLDEPFAGIDPIAVADIKNMIHLLANRGIGILITDHNVRDTLTITDRAIIVNHGTIVIQGTKEEILASEEAREIYLGKDFSL